MDQFATIIAVIVAILTMNIVLGLAWQLLEYVWRASLKEELLGKRRERRPE